MANEVIRSMPCSIEAEQYVLGAIIFDNDCMPDVMEKLKVDDFYLEQHKRIYESMIHISNRGEPVDLITLKSETEAVFESIGGMEYLTQITLMVSTTANLKYHVQIILDKSILRKLIKASNDILDISYDSANEVPVILNSAENKIFNIMENRGLTELSPIKDVLTTNLANLENLMKNKGAITGVPTGFAELDKRTAGLQPSDFILVGARPAMGKTSFVLNIATNAAMDSGVPVAIFSLEMSKEQLANRIMSSVASIEGGKMKVGDLDGDDIRRMALAVDKLSKAPIYIDDTSGITVSEIRAKCRRLKLKGELGLIVIDYLQLMQGSGRESRQQDVSDISRSLKIMAKELNVPVIALSQLSREADKRTNHRPILSDLRESGAIEQDADMVMFLYRDDYYNENSDEKNVAECIIAKFRNGSTDTFKMGWRGEFTKFTNLDMIHTEN